MTGRESRAGSMILCPPYPANELPMKAKGAAGKTGRVRPEYRRCRFARGTGGWLRDRRGALLQRAETAAPRSGWRGTMMVVRLGMFPAAGHGRWRRFPPRRDGCWRRARAGRDLRLQGCERRIVHRQRCGEEFEIAPFLDLDAEATEFGGVGGGLREHGGKAAEQSAGEAGDTAPVARRGIGHAGVEQEARDFCPIAGV